MFEASLGCIASLSQNKTTDRRTKITTKPIHKAEVLEGRGKMAEESQETGAVTENDLINDNGFLNCQKYPFHNYIFFY